MSEALLFNPTERQFARAIAGLVGSNPFLPERIEAERAALGARYVAHDPVWTARAVPNPNLDRIAEAAGEALEAARERLARGVRHSREDQSLYHELALYTLYTRYEDALLAAALAPPEPRPQMSFYRSFARDFERYMGATEHVEEGDPAHAFAIFFQIRRAFQFIFWHILGGSMPAARLRAAVWQSIFTHDHGRYRRGLFRQMRDVTTLVTGPSGTGKELVARAIGLSRFVPFDPETCRFREDYRASFHPLNLSALSPTLIESELFGHCRGSFTGAVQDRIGRLEICQPSGTVFLDEIGDVAPAIQVKLLRVLQTRAFQRIGEQDSRRFEGKIVAATNRDPAAELRAGNLRTDFYYRICSDRIEAPSLRDQLDDRPEDLETLTRVFAARAAGEREAEALTGEVLGWIERHLPERYPWPGNVRELEQCVRSVMIRGRYAPALTPVPDPTSRLDDALRSARLTADELLGRYCAVVYEQAGSYMEAARRLGIDRRTVRQRVQAQARDGSS